MNAESYKEPGPSHKRPGFLMHGSIHLVLVTWHFSLLQRLFP
jgi:hypothetical protein